MNTFNIDSLRQKFVGKIILPTDADYESARAVMMKKGSPAIIVKPTSANEVSLALAFAQENNLVVSIRSGGHSGAGFGTNDDGLVADLSAINKIEILDSEKHLVKIGAGAHWGDVATELQKHGLAISSGDTSSVGVGGLTLGGGIGWMVRKYGLAIDSLVAAEVVTADGQIVRACDTEHTDLFWALRGGGGNFGVVTYFEFMAHPIGKVFAGAITYKLDTVSQLLTGWRDFMRTAPEELTTMFMLLPSFGGNPPAAIVNCCFASDDSAKASQIIAALEKIGTVVSQKVTEKEYSEVLEEAHAPEGVRVMVNNAFVKDFSDELIAAIVTAQQAAGNLILQIRGLGGAMKRVAKDSTAFSHRDSEVLLVSPVFIPLDATEDAIEAAMKPWQSIATFTLGAYINFFSEATTWDYASAYPAETYERLRTVKKIYDPKNIFNQNFNIPPAE